MTKPVYGSNRQNNIVAGNNSQLHFLLAMRGYQSVKMGERKVGCVCYGKEKIWRGNKAWIVYGTGTIKIVIGNP